ncbi:Protein translocase subunit SecE [subsurface metagenome]
MTHHAAKKSSRFRFGFIRETIGELKKVTWLSRREIVYLTFLVLIVALVTGLILGAVDYGFTRLVNEVFLVR